MAVSVTASAVGLPEFSLVAADWQTELAEIDTYESATVIPRHNEIGTYELVLPAATRAAQVLLNAGRPRIVVYADGEVFRSGPVTRVERTLDADGDVVTFNGVDDLVWLARRLAHPQPGTAAPPYSTTESDDRTGQASQVIAGYVDRNAGPAAVSARRVPGLTVAVPAPFGGTVALSARYQNLLAFLQDAAAAARLGIRVRNLAFEVYQPSGAAVFSVELGTLAGWTSVLEAPEVTYAYVAGQGVGTARTIREYANAQAVIDWGRTETFVDRRDTDVVAELDQAGAETLAEGVAPITVSMEAMNTTGQRFLRDWNVGDLATVQVGDLTRTDVIAEALIVLEANAPPMISPTIGGSALTLAQWRAAQQQAKRLRQLERI